MANEVLKVSLRDYKKEIESLKADLLSLDRGTEQYAKTLDELRAKQSKLNEVNADAKRQNDALDGSYAALSQQMAALKKEWRETNDVAKRNELGTQINGINTQLKELDASLGNYQRNVGNYEGATVSLKQQLRELNATMAEMLASGIRETDAGFVELAQKAGRIKDALSDAKAVTAEYANDVRGMAIGVDIAKNLAAGYGAINGALHIFGVESKTANEITAKMTVIMTTLNSLQSINKAIMDSASPTRRAAIQLWQALTGAKQKDIVATTEQTISEKAATLNTEANTVAMEANTVATNTATVATNNFKKALIATGIGAIIVLIGTLIAKWDDLTAAISRWFGKSQSQLEMEKKLSAEEERHSARLRELKNVYSQVDKTKNDVINKFKLLQARIKDANGDINKQKAVLGEYNEKWGKVGGTVKNYGELVKRVNKDILENVKKYANLKAKEVEHGLYLEKKARLEMQKKELEELKIHENKKLITIHEANVKRAKEQLEWLEKIPKIFRDPATQQLIAGYNAVLNSKPNQLGKESNIVKGIEEVNSEIEKTKKNITSTTVEIAKLQNEAPSSWGYGGDTTNSGGSSGGGTSKNTENENKALEHQSEVLSELNEKREKELENVRYIYELAKAQGEEGTMIERGRIEDEHAIRTQYFEEYMKQLEADLNSTEFNAEQKKKIEKDYAKVKEEQTKEAHDYAIKLEANRTKAEKNLMQDRIKTTTDEINNYKSQYEELRKDIHSKWTEINENLDENDEVQKLKNEQAEREEVYNAQIEAFNNQIAAAKELLATLDPLSEEYAKLSENITSMTAAQNDATEKFNEETSKNQRQTAKAEKKELQTRFKSYLNFTNSMTDLVDTISSVEKQRIDQKVKDGKISEKEAEKEFERVKAMQIGVAIMNTLAGAAGGFAATISDKSIQPSWVRYATAGVIAAAALAQGYEQVRQIQSTTYGGGAGSAASSTGGGAVQLATSPLLNENLDANSLQEVSVSRLGDIRQGQTDQRVYVLETDLQKSAKRVEVRQKNTTF